MNDFLTLLSEKLKTNAFISLGGFILAVLITVLLYKTIVKLLRSRTPKSEDNVKIYLIDSLSTPTLWLIFLTMTKIYVSYSFLAETEIYAKWFSKPVELMLIICGGWISTRIVSVFIFLLKRKLMVNVSDNNVAARGEVTKIKIFESLINATIWIIVVSVCLMSFEKVRTLGVSLLTSAGIAGIIVGFAAQKSLAAILAGIQIAITQPIRIGDVVIVENEWGKIEEISLTYVVVKIWDERMLVLPVSYFLEQPFQNWTKYSSEITGTIFFYVDYNLPVEAVRDKLKELLTDNPDWDGRRANVLVTDMKPTYKEVRIAISSDDAEHNWRLRVTLREKIIEFISQEYPDCFVKTRLLGADSFDAKSESVVADNNPNAEV